MSGALLYAYLGGWVVTSIGVAIVAWRLQDKQEPAAHPVLLTIVAGAAWPVLVLALAETAFVALSQEAKHDDEPVLSVVA